MHKVLDQEQEQSILMESDPNKRRLARLRSLREKRSKGFPKATDFGDSLTDGQCIGAVLLYHNRDKLSYSGKRHHKCILHVLFCMILILFFTDFIFGQRLSRNDSLANLNKIKSFCDSHFSLPALHMTPTQWLDHTPDGNLKANVIAFVSFLFHTLSSLQFKRGIHVVTPSMARGMIATPTFTSTPLRKLREQERLENKARTLYHPIMDISSISSSSLPSQCTCCKRTECACKRLPQVDSGSSAVELSFSSTFTLPERKKEGMMKLSGAVRNACSVSQNSLLSSFGSSVPPPSLPPLSNSHLSTDEGLLKASPKKKTLITPSLESLGITLSKPNQQTQVKIPPAPTDAESISSGNTRDLKALSDQVDHLDPILREGYTTIQEDQQDNDTITPSHGEELPDRSVNTSNETVIIDDPTRIDVPQLSKSDTESPIPPTDSQINVSPQGGTAMSPISTPPLQATEEIHSPVIYSTPIPPPSSPILPMSSPPLSSAPSSVPSSVSPLHVNGSPVNGEKSQKEEDKRVQPVCHSLSLHIQFDHFNNIKDWTLKPKLQHQMALIKELMKRDELEKRADSLSVKDKEETEVVVKTQQLSRTSSSSSLVERQKKEDEEEEKRKRKEKVIKARLAERDRKRKNSMKERRMVDQNIELKKEPTRGRSMLFNVIAINSSVKKIPASLSLFQNLVNVAPLLRFLHQ